MKGTFLLAAASLLCAATLRAESAATPLQYNRDVRPILSENCYACHGFDEAAREADLRLDIAESATEDRGDYAAIVPGDPDGSEAWRRITSEDESEVMPPVDSHHELSTAEKETIRRWIAEGAKYERHWSFIPPSKPALPDVAQKDWIRNEVDRFVSARLEAEELAPSPEADKRTLIRRLYLDLTGLPPSAEEVAAFAADEYPDAYARLVDRLLASPHFGERMALEWLDAARYADTNGFSIDGGRHMWLWRDWVIDSFNRNRPYDQFLVEQLAGDLLPGRTEAQLVASGFQRNNMVTHEGGTIPEENLANYNVDRVKTLGEAVLGLTIGCAQCHDHKYDPITQRDYYRLYAYFNTLSDAGLDGNAGVNPRPFVEAKTVLPTNEPTNELPELEQRMAELRKELAKPTAEAVETWVGEQQAALAVRGRELELHPIEVLKVSTPNAGSGFEVEAKRFVTIGGAGGLVAYDVATKLPNTGKPITGIRVIFHPAANTPGGGWGFGTLPLTETPPSDLPRTRKGKRKARPAKAETSDAAGETNDLSAKGTFVLTSLSASAEGVSGDQVNLNLLRELRRVTANTWREDYRPEGVLDTETSGWSPRAAHDGPVHLTATFAEPIDAAKSSYLTLQVNFGINAPLVGARFEFVALTGEDDGSDLPEELIRAVQAPKETRSEQDQLAIEQYYAEHSAATMRLRVELANLIERRRVLTEKFTTMVMDEAPQPRETFILERGNYAAPTEKVAAGTPSALPAAPAGTPANRLGLAQWLVTPSHPLTARVAVNRFWQTLFGTGLVRTSADFGNQGAWPTHPELLDWLAVDFVESGWDVKELVRTIVTSSTYRQSSAVNEALAARDPENQLLARGPRFRLAAEFIRDGALKTSGLLVERIGGPSVNPYTPGDLWREISHYGSSPATAQTFVQDHGEKLYRRSLYTYWKRTAPPPNMAAFDAPNREICVVQRPATTTPLQALVLLNDVQFVEAARAFAERVLKRGTDDAARLQWAFEECMSRPATEDELAVLARALERERQRYAADQAAAAKYLASGESPRDEAIPAAEHAAWSQVAAMMMNLSETVTRN